MYELYYWPTIPGRGELVRLVLEDAGADYVDVARLPERGGASAIRAVLAGEGFSGPMPYAPPILRDGPAVISHTALILQYLGPRVDAVPADELARLHAHQLTLSVMDIFKEVHDTHHPVSASLYYEEQRSEAARSAATFLRDRLPRHLGYFERVIERAGGAHALGEPSYVDLALFQLVSGLRYAFPRASVRFAAACPLLVALADRVAARPRLAAYLASPRRLPFNEHGIFRRYPELDVSDEGAT